MKLVESFVLPQSFVEAVGKEWEGTYEVYALNAREYLKMQSDATSFMVEETKKSNMEWDGVVPNDVINLFLVCYSVKFGGEQLNPRSELPGKLYEVLSIKALPHNTISKGEFEALFLFSGQKAEAT